MKRKHYLILTLFLMIVFCLCASSHAMLARAKFDVFTTQEPSFTKKLQCRLWFPRTRLRPPDVVSSVRIDAPDGTVFEFENPEHFWLEFEESFFFTFRWYHFESEEIPSGVYKAIVKFRRGRMIKLFDSVQVNFLEPPSIIVPSDEDTISLPGEIEWEKVAGAKVYKMEMYNDDWGTPVYYWPEEKFAYVDERETTFKFPKGVLRPGYRYRLVLYAHDNTRDVDNRSRKTVYFHTYD